MISQSLRDARKYEEEKKVKEEERPVFHLTPMTGWMNDPNGFSFYKGKYHLFYQYNPYDCKWGLMHWGHAVSEDLLRWTHLPAALAPDTQYDRDGCFSGSAEILPDGSHLLMYTGVSKEVQPDGTMKELQMQCIAIGDGMDYEKYPLNPVLTQEDLPEGGSKFDFRDPKIWKEKDGTYRCVVGNCDKQHSGWILLYSSEDGYSWKYETLLEKNENRFGRMWECPDFFPLDGKQVLLVSPQDMLPEGYEYHNGNGTLCLIGTYDEENKKFQAEFNQAIDYGIDFYATQTILTPDGRRVMIAWMQNWDTCGMSSEEPQWFGQMCLPRELSVKNGRLYQRPVRELEKYRSGRIEYRNIRIENDTISLEHIRGRKVDMEIQLRPGEEGNIYQKFAVRFAQNELWRTSVSFRPHESILKIDRKFSGSRRAVIHQRRSKVTGETGKLKLRLILDKYSVEIFVNDGEQVLSATIPTDQAADGISFYADGAVEMDVIKYDLFAEV